MMLWARCWGQGFGRKCFDGNEDFGSCFFVVHSWYRSELLCDLLFPSSSWVP